VCGCVCVWVCVCVCVCGVCVGGGKGGTPIWGDMWMDEWNDRITYYLAAREYLLHRASGRYYSMMRRPMQESSPVSEGWMISESTWNSWTKRCATSQDSDLYEFTRTKNFYAKWLTWTRLGWFPYWRSALPQDLYLYPEERALHLECNSWLQCYARFL